MVSQHQTFDQALFEFEKARSAAAEFVGAAASDARNDELTESIDQALDRLLAAESPSFMALRTKLRLLEREYGNEWQPRHVAALLGDAAILN